MKALVAGLGSIGCRHLRNLHALGVRDLSAFRSRKLPPPADIPEGITTYHDFEVALADGPTLVVIANPSALHVPLAKRALEAGCHVYLEKPVSDSLDGVAVLEDLAASKDLRVAVGCQFRFHPHLQQLKSWIDEKRWGRVFSVLVDTGEHLPDWHPWEDYRQGYAARKDQGGGVVLTQIHDLDYLHWLFGPMERVFAIGGNLTPLDLDVEDTALVSLLTKDRTPILLRTDYWRKPPVKRLHAVCEKAELTWDYHRRSLTASSGGEIVENVPLDPTWERNQMFLASMSNFLMSIENSTAPAIPLSEGVRVLKVALAIKESLLHKEGVAL